MRLLFVDDERAFTDLVLAELPRTWNKYAAYNLKDARRILDLNQIDVIVLDLKLPDGDGMDLLRELRTRSERPEVFILTGHGSVIEAVEAMRLGVFDFITKPVTIDHLESIITAAGIRKGVPSSAQGATGPLDTSLPPGLRKLGWQALEIARTDIPLLLYGEAGVGKRWFANLIYETAAPNTPGFTVDCADPDSFRAVLNRVMTGSIHHASPNEEVTLILHEVARLSQDNQGILVDLLSDPAANRLRDNTDQGMQNVRIRFMATTSEVIQNHIESGAFREDLFFRLSGFTLGVPPLRDRPDDILSICDDVLTKRLASPARQALLNHPWPGNVEELLFVLRVTCDAAEQAEVIRKSHIESAFGAAGDYYRMPISGPLALRDIEHAHIHRVLRFTKGNQTHAARLLGIDPKTLYRKLRAEEASTVPDRDPVA